MTTNRDEDYVDLDAVDYRTGDGTRVTNQLAAQWAQEYEHRPGPGRPFLDPARQPSVHLGFRAPTTVAERLDQVAEAMHLKRSDVLRRALEDYLAAH